MTVEAENLVEQFLAETIHHRHHDDEGGDAQHDAEEGEPGDHRDESFLAPRPQVAQRQHPLKRREGPRPVGLGHCLLVPVTGISHDSGGFKPVISAKAFGSAQDCWVRRRSHNRLPLRSDLDQYPNAPQSPYGPSPPLSPLLPLTPPNPPCTVCSLLPAHWRFLPPRHRPWQRIVAAAPPRSAPAGF